MVGVEAAAPVAGVGVAVVNQAKNPAETVVPAAAAPTIRSAQYPDAFVDVWRQSLKRSAAIESFNSCSSGSLVCCGMVFPP